MKEKCKFPYSFLLEAEEISIYLKDSSEYASGNSALDLMTLSSRILLLKDLECAISNMAVINHLWLFKFKV